MICLTTLFNYSWQLLWLSGGAHLVLGRSSSSTGFDRPKSLKQVVTAPLPALDDRRECHGSSEMTLKKDVPCHNMFDMLQTIVTNAKYKLKFAFLHQ